MTISFPYNLGPDDTEVMVECTVEYERGDYPGDPPGYVVEVHGAVNAAGADVPIAPEELGRIEDRAIAMARDNEDGAP